MGAEVTSHTTRATSAHHPVNLLFPGSPHLTPSCKKTQSVAARVPDKHLRNTQMCPVSLGHWTVQTRLALCTEQGGVQKVEFSKLLQNMHSLS